MKSSRTLVFRGNLPWPLRLVALMLIPVHLLTAVPAGVTAIALSTSPERQGPQQPPTAAFVTQHLMRQPKPPAVPKFSTPSREQKISAQPTDRELMLLRGLDQPLLPLKCTPIAGENAALAKALDAFLKKTSSDKPLLEFLSAFAKSRWAPAVLANLGYSYHVAGRLTRAADALEKSWTQCKEESSSEIKLMADRAVGELAEIYTDLREFKKLEELNDQLASRDVRGAGSAKLSDALTRKSFLESLPVEKRFRCGPLAVRELFRFFMPGKPLPVDRGKVEVTEQGARMSDLLVYAKAHGLDYQIAFRAPGADVIQPSVVHWKAGHYTWIKQKLRDGYLSREAVFGLESTVTKEVLDEEASGYCLVPAGDLPPGWRHVLTEEAQKVVGTGQTPPPGPPLPPCNTTTAKPCPKACGMANYNLDLHSIALMLIDTPLSYAPPVGPAVEFTANYNSREETTMSNISNLGSKWSFGWSCYVSDYGTFNTRRYGPSGGVLDYFTGPSNLFSGSAGIVYPVNRVAQDILTKVSSTKYVLVRIDGSQEIFDIAEPGNNPRVFRSKSIDPQGNAITYGYDSNFRIRTVTDAQGKVSVIDYELTTDSTNADFYKITKVTDPYGRFASFQYNPLGQLWKMTDTIGMTSEFTYGTGDFASKLTTPYGTTSFYTTENSNVRVLDVTGPDGARERVEWNNSGTGVPVSDAVAPSGFNNSYLQYRNSYYWDKKAMSERAGDYAAAQITHFLHSSEYGMSYLVESTKSPRENRVWYGYYGQQGIYAPSSSSAYNDTNKPVRIARVLDDGTEQNYYYEYNGVGKPTKITDPLGRETAFDYATGGIDLLSVRQKSTSTSIAPGAAGYLPGGNSVMYLGNTGATTSTAPIPTGPSVKLLDVSYNTQHLPLTVTDAAGQTTTYSYNSAGQIRTLTNAKNETTTFWYHTTGQIAQGETLDSNASGVLVKIDGPVAGATASFTYDDFGRVCTATDSQGYTVTTDYDIFDRPAKITYPDSTYEQILYSKLDAEWLRDREGRWTHQFHDANRHLVAVVDSSYRATNYDWCGCGSLDSIVDPAGRRTTWQRDVQGRVTAKIYPDRTQDTFTYDLASRLKKVTDAKGQVANYTYYLDDALAAVTYTDTAGAPLSPATPGVTYGYDPYYQRLTSMTDVLGTTNYAYNPYATYVSGSSIPASAGVGRLATITGPQANATIALTYDELGRVLSRSINGSANTTTVHYDSLGRVDTTTNALGTFNLGYVGVTGRLDHVDYPNGQQTNYAYYGNTAPTGTGNGDQRLQQIHNLAPGGANLSTFGYTYDVVGQIKTWSRQNHTGTVLTSSFNYDSIGQLLSAAVPSASSTVKNYTYGYDLAGNRTQEQIDSGVTTSVHNNLNQQTGQSPGGVMEFAGTLNEPATVTLAGKPANVDGSNNWTGKANVTAGVNSIPLVATDASGNSTTKTINLVVSGGTARTLAFDLAGNETDNGAGQAYTYDALNRLKTITQGANVTEFVYNGVGQRVQEKLNGSLIKQWIWDGGAQPAEERDASGNVTKRFFGGGEQIGGINYYFTTDHLGSVREMTDAVGAIRARYEYDPYGRQTKVSGDLESDIGFTGFYRHQASGLNFTITRAYDADLGRWTSRDTIEEMGGINLYVYVGNNPLNLIDPYGRNFKTWLSAAGAGVGFILSLPVDFFEDVTTGGAGVVLNPATTGVMTAGGAATGAIIGNALDNLVNNMSGSDYDDWKPSTRDERPDKMKGEDSDVTKGKKLTPEQREKLKDAIERYKKGRGRGGCDNLNNEKIDEILDDILNDM